jgi:site-specific DNA-methyltransferase (adenine-specific)
MSNTEDIKLYKGDCLELMKDIPDKSIDMILCDLPYGTTACKWDVVIPFDELWEQYNRVIKDNGAIVLFGSEPFSSKLRMSNLKMYKYDWKWLKSRKTGFQIVKKRPLKSYEDINVFYKKQPTYYNTELIKLENPINSYRKNGKGGSLLNTVKCKKGRMQEYTNYNKDTLYFNNEHNVNAFHPTQKPVALMEYLIKTYTNDGDLVLDNCMGSGSTGVACINTNRKFIGMELDENYFEIAQNRINKVIKEKTI